MWKCDLYLLCKIKNKFKIFLNISKWIIVTNLNKKDFNYFIVFQQIKLSLLKTNK